MDFCREGEGLRVHQETQYCTTSDDVRLAYSVIGKGTPIVRASHWLSHLEYDLKYPVYRHLILGLAHRHSLIRYDGRGIGLSQRQVTEFSFERWISDLECVVDALSLKRFVLFGMSQGAPISIEQNWFIKLIVILAAIAGVLLFAEEVWRFLRRGLLALPDSANKLNAAWSIRSRIGPAGYGAVGSGVGLVFLILDTFT